MADSNSTQLPGLDSEAFETAIEVQRERLFTAAGLAATTAEALDPCHQAGADPRDDALARSLRESVRLIEQVASELGTTVLRQLAARIESGELDHEEFDRLPPPFRDRLRERRLTA